jgi:hypothetical protein
VEEHRLRAFGNRVLRVSEPKRDKVMEGWRKLHNEEPHNLYSSPSIIKMIKSRMMRWAGHVARMGVKRNAYKILLAKPEGKRLLERPRCRWTDNIKMDLKRDRIGMVWTGLIWLSIGTSEGLLLTQ